MRDESKDVASNKATQELVAPDENRLSPKATGLGTEGSGAQVASGRDPIKLQAEEYGFYNQDVIKQAADFNPGVLGALEGMLKNAAFKGLGTLENPVKILDVGIGGANGTISLMKEIRKDPVLWNLHFVVYGVDPNHEALFDEKVGADKTMRDYSGVDDKVDHRFYDCKISELPNRSEYNSVLKNKVHLVISNATKHHIVDEDFDESVRVEAELLAPGGVTIGLTGGKGVFSNDLYRNIAIDNHGASSSSLEVKYENMLEPKRLLYDNLRKQYQFLPVYHEGGKKLMQDGSLLKFRDNECYADSYASNGLTVQVSEAVPMPSIVSRDVYKGWLDAWVGHEADALIDQCRKTNPSEEVIRENLDKTTDPCSSLGLNASEGETCSRQGFSLDKLSDSVMQSMRDQNSRLYSRDSEGRESYTKDFVRVRYQAQKPLEQEKRGTSQLDDSQAFQR